VLVGDAIFGRFKPGLGANFPDSFPGVAVEVGTFFVSSDGLDFDIC
jgi:hypothetical protein